MFKKFVVILFLFSFTACATPQKNMNIEPAVLIKKMKPVYPPQALANRTEGWAWVGYTVTQSGVVISPVVTKSSQEGVFDASALLAIYQFEYKPRKVNGVATSITGMSYRFEYDLEKYPQNYYQE